MYKKGLPGKSILGDYLQENMTSRRPFLLLRISFPGRPIFIQLPPGRPPQPLQQHQRPQDPPGGRRGLAHDRRRGGHAEAGKNFKPLETRNLPLHPFLVVPQICHAFGKALQSGAGGLIHSWVDLDIQSGAAGCGKGFVTCFLRVPQTAGLNCSCHAAQASTGNFQETCYKTFCSTCRPRL